LIQVIKLKIENQDSLMGADILQPRFSWIIESEGTGINQSAYQINVFEKESSGLKS